MRRWQALVVMDGLRDMEKTRMYGRLAALIPILTLLGSFVISGLAWADDKERKPGEVPRESSDLFDMTRVWTLHLRFTAEQWAAMEPKGGNANFFDPSMFGMGMFLQPVVMKDGDGNGDGDITSEEFRQLAEKWFTAWDQDKDGSVDSKQVRAGLKVALTPLDGEAAGGFGAGGGGFSLQGRDGKPNGLASVMGIEFPQVHADLEFQSQLFSNVAVRYKGNGTFVQSRGSLKRSIKIDLNKYVKGQKLAGVTTLNLHNGVTDPGMMNETLAYHFYRQEKVPTPRTSYARVYITVPGRHARQYFGLYTVVENIDDEFLAHRNLPENGALFKPSTPVMFTYLGEDWKKYQQSYEPKTNLTEAQKRRLIELCHLVSKANDADFAAKLGDYIDLEEFARFMAVGVWIADLDSILTTSQNFYAYLNPRTNRFSFIPWDKDHTFGSWIGDLQANRDRHSIHQPWEGRKLFLERVFKVPAFRDPYLKHMADFNSRFNQEQFVKQVNHIAKNIRPAVQDESAQKLTQFDRVAAGQTLQSSGFNFGGSSSQTLIPFAKVRAKSVTEQLEGKAKGHILGRLPSGRPQQPLFRPEDMVEPALLKALDADKDKKLTRKELVDGFNNWFTTWDTDKKGTLPEDKMRQGLNKALPFPSFGRPPGGNPGQPASKKASGPGL